MIVEWNIIWSRRRYHSFVGLKSFRKSCFSSIKQLSGWNNIFYKIQSGFLGTYSTDTCLIHLQDHIRKQTASGHFTGMIPLDIQKAFDIVDHNILCNKLSAMGIQPTNWFRSYLSDRKQIVNINGIESDPLANSCGIPQGSILVPFCFYALLTTCQILPTV